MKKGMFFALAASSLLFSACSSDDTVVSTEGQNEAVQQIVLHVASSGDGLTTRAGRPLYSSQALQTIQNVRVLIYKNETGGGEKTIVYDKKLYMWLRTTLKIEALTSATFPFAATLFKSDSGIETVQVLMILPAVSKS
jgi:hypothetical protein